MATNPIELEYPEKVSYLQREYRYEFADGMPADKIIARAEEDAKRFRSTNTGKLFNNSDSAFITKEFSNPNVGMSVDETGSVYAVWNQATDLKNTQPLSNSTADHEVVSLCNIYFLNSDSASFETMRSVLEDAEIDAIEHCNENGMVFDSSAINVVSHEKYGLIVIWTSEVPKK